MCNSDELSISSIVYVNTIMDMLIAAHAKSADTILVTSNTNEFDSVQNLKLKIGSLKINNI